MSKEIIHIKGLEFLLQKKRNVKKLYVKVSDPSGSLKIVAPSNTSKGFIRRFISENYEAIVEMRDKFISNNIDSIKSLVGGEAHELWGTTYRLSLIESKKNKVDLKDDKLLMQITDINDFDLKEKTLKIFHRQLLEGKLPAIVCNYCQLMDLEIPEYRIKDMKTRWGSCNIIDKRIWLSLKLALYPEHCLEYVVVHELVHLFERKHNKTFYSLVEEYYPNWREAEIELNSKARKI